jgi:hypothetical protein
MILLLINNEQRSMERPALAKPDAEPRTALSASNVASVTAREDGLRQGHSRTTAQYGLRDRRYERDAPANPTRNMVSRPTSRSGTKYSLKAELRGSQRRYSGNLNTEILSTSVITPDLDLVSATHDTPTRCMEE